MKKLKKGFTLVELVIVIAVIAVLAAVLIPTFSGIVYRAKLTADISTAESLSTIALANATIEEFVNDVKNDDTMKLENLNPQLEGNKFIWAHKGTTASIVYVDKDFKVLDGTEYNLDEADQLWAFVLKPSDIMTSPLKNINYFVAKDITAGQTLAINKLASIKTGDNFVAANVSITDASATGTATIEGTFNGTVTINTPNANIEQDGTIKNLNVTAVKSNSLELNGFVDTMSIDQGRVVLNSTAYVNSLTVNDEDVLVSNSGVIATLDKKEGITLAPTNFTNVGLGTMLNTADAGITGKTNDNYVLTINNLADLEKFRDQVNAGATFAGLKVQLAYQASIALPTNWEPIGAFARAKTVQGFQGTFDGNGGTISGLVTDNYDPKDNALTNATGTTIVNKKEYVYGLFGYVSNAKFTNLNITGVNINIPSTTAEYGDSVGALVGYSYGTLDVSFVTVGTASDNSTISAYDGVAGIVGRAYAQADVEKQVHISSCTNHAAINAGEKAGGIVGIVSSGKINLTLNACNNYGPIKADGEAQVRTVAYAGGMVGLIGTTIKSIAITGCVNDANITANKAAGSTATWDQQAEYFVAKNTSKATYNTDSCTGSGTITKN